MHTVQNFRASAGLDGVVDQNGAVQVHCGCDLMTGGPFILLALERETEGD